MKANSSRRSNFVIISRVDASSVVAILETIQKQEDWFSFSSTLFVLIRSLGDLILSGKVGVW